MKRTLAAAAVALLVLATATPTAMTRPVDPGCSADDVAEGAPLC